MTDLSPEDRAFLELARKAPGPTATDRTRVRRAIAAAAPLAGLGALTASSQAAGASLGLAKGVLLFAVSVGVGSGLVVGAIAIKRSNSPPPLTRPVAPAPKARVVAAEPAVAPAESPAAPHAESPAGLHAEPPAALAESPAMAVAPAPPPSPEAPARAPPPAKRSAPKRAPEEPTPAIAPPAAPAPAHLLEPRCSVEAEATAIQQAQRLLATAPQRSLDAFDALERDCPGGELIEERHVLRALALCALGRRDEGRVHVDWLQHHRPASPALPRLSKACAVEGP